MAINIGRNSLFNYMDSLIKYFDDLHLLQFNLNKLVLWSKKNYN